MKDGKMIKSLEVKNFKSIKHLSLDCRKVNIFIGKPNTGKSNILESVGIFSIPYTKNPDTGRWYLKDLIRFENMANLFYDQDLSEKIEITADDIYFEIKFEVRAFLGRNLDKEKEIFSFGCDYSGEVSETQYSRHHPYLLASPFKFYRFTIMDEFRRHESDFLLPPRGENLLQILQTNKTLRKVAADMFSEYGLKIVLKPQESKIEVQKEIEDVIISYPYSLVSDTLQRLVFHCRWAQWDRGGNKGSLPICRYSAVCDTPDKKHIEVCVLEGQEGAE